MPTIIQDQEMLNTVRDWNIARTQAKFWIEREQSLRKQIVFDGRFFNPNKEKGSETVQLPDGWKLKSNKKISFTLGSADAVRDALEFMSAAVREKIVSWSARLSESTYKTLSAQDRTVIDEVLTTKPGMPELELIQPKEN